MERSPLNDGEKLYKENLRSLLTYFEDIVGDDAGNSDPHHDHHPIRGGFSIILKYNHSYAPYID